jgi:hypothetical protein
MESNPYEVPPSLRTKFRNPMLCKHSSLPPQLITPQTHKTTKNKETIEANFQNGSNTPSTTNPYTPNSAIDTMSFNQAVRVEKETYERIPAISNPPNTADKALSRLSAHTETTNLRANDIISPFNIKNPYTDRTKQDTQSNGITSWSYITSNNRQKIYHSPFLDSSVRQSSLHLELKADLETLRPLILLQHEAFSQYIMDLGELNLTLTKIIERKKESYSFLDQKKKIPRSLHIKCTLSASPEFSNDAQFIQLKEEFDNNVATFIEKNTNIMKNWALVNIQLLIEDRCHKIFKKALLLLDGLISFHAKVIGIPSWPSITSANLMLFIAKIYLSNES